jgi:hypothetical protein
MTELQPDNQPVITLVTVVNGNDIPIHDMFDGVPLRFPPGETVTIKPEVAMHCFGYPGEPHDMAVHMSKRYGWNGLDYIMMVEGDPERRSRYEVMASKVVIKPVYFDLVQRKPDDPIPADDNEDDLPPTLDDMSNETGTKVGKRAGSKARGRRPVELGGKRKPGRPRKETAAR